MYLTAEVKKYADQLGIDDEGVSKLYKTSRNVNRFLKAEKAVEAEAVHEISDGGAENECNEEEHELQ